MKILHIIWSLELGGAERYLVDLLTQHQSFGEHTSEVLVLSTQGPFSEPLKQIGIPIHYMELRSGTDIRGILRLRTFLQRHTFDILHSHSNNLALNWLLRSVSAFKLYTEHGGGLLGCQSGGGWKDRFIYRFFADHYDGYIAISHAIAALMIQTNPKIKTRITIIHNGTDVTAIEQTPACAETSLPNVFFQAGKRVGIVARLSPEKGVANFINTAAIILRSIPDTVFAIIGDGNLRNELELLARDLGIANNLLFLGYRNDAISIIKHFDVFLSTSKTEGFGLVLIEAMAAGIPIVALNMTGAISEIISNGRDGFVVETENFEEIADRTIKLLHDSSLRQEFVNNAYIKVRRNFSIENNAKKILILYKKFITN